MFTVNEIALAFKVSRQTVWNWVKAGKLHAIKVNERGDIRCTWEDLNRFLQA